MSRSRRLPKEKQKNEVRDIYSSFTAEEISNEISRLLKPPKLKSKLEIIYQNIEDLHLSCPMHTGIGILLVSIQPMAETLLLTGLLFIILKVKI